MSFLPSSLDIVPAHTPRVHDNFHMDMPTKAGEGIKLTFNGLSSSASAPSITSAAAQPAHWAARSSSKRCFSDDSSCARSRNMAGASSSSASAKRCCRAAAERSPCLQRDRLDVSCQSASHKAAVRSSLCDVPARPGLCLAALQE